MAPSSEPPHHTGRITRGAIGKTPHVQSKWCRRSAGPSLRDEGSWGLAGDGQILVTPVTTGASRGAGHEVRGHKQLVEPTQVLSRLNLTPIILPCESRASIVTGTGFPSRQTNMTRTSTRDRPPSGAATTGA